MPETDPRGDARIARSLRLAWLFDSAVRIPGTRIRFGLDPLLGVVPGLGDALAALLGGYIVWSAVRAGAPRLMVGRMLVNVAVDALVGAVPLLGTIFDVAFKSHHRNARMLADWSHSPAAATAGGRRMLLSLAGTAVLLAVIAAGAVAFGTWALIRLLG